MATEQGFDVVAARRSALAAIIAAFAWPVVTAAALFTLSDTLEKLVLSTSSFSVAGVKFEKWVDDTSLSEAQLKAINNFTTDEIVRFLNNFRENSSLCVDGPNELRGYDEIYLKAGLIAISESACGDQKYSVAMTRDGASLHASLTNIIRSVLSRSIVNNNS